MKRLHALVAILSVLVPAPSALAQNHYDWTISASSTDPFDNSMTPSGTLATVYLWFNCSSIDGMAAAEFDIVSTGISHVATTPVNGFINAGSTTYMLLAVGGCPLGPVVAANLLTFQLAPGSMCLAPAAATGNKVTVDCQPQPTAYPIEWRGLDIGGGPCEKGSVCHADPFPFPCCLPDGTCLDLYGLPGDCEALGGTIPAAGSCEDAECATVSIDEESWGRTKGRYAR